MTLPIEDYALIGDLHTSALVGRDGSIDWLCLPRFDSAACFAKLLGGADHGCWRIAPRRSTLATRRRYRGESLVLESEFATEQGVVRVVDCMPIRQKHPEVIRLVEGVRGKVTMEMKLTIRFGYGEVVPWVRRVNGTLVAIAGPDGLSLWTPVDCIGEGLSTVAQFTVSEGQRIPFSLTWFPANEEPPRPVDAGFAIQDTALWWTDWSAQCTYQGDYRDQVVRSLITLKALTYFPTGGIVAAATTSLPETLGGGRNWDYRFCWLRDATLTLESLMRGGFYDEAMAWRNWLLRASAGDPSQLQIMYGAGGERRLEEWEVEWLPGYEGSSPVRIGNAAAGQFQLDVYGEVMSALYESAQRCEWENDAWEFQLALMSFVEQSWREPDDGIWEVRGPRRHFTHSKVMAWVAIDRAIKTAEEFGLDGPVDRWKVMRKEIHNQVCDLGFNKEKGSFTQYYGSEEVDASLLMIPMVGFLPATDPRVRGTIEAVERDLMDGGFVLRYRTKDSGDVDGLTGREGAFLACSFWLADCLSMLGRDDDAREMLERLIGLCNDVGLLSEEYDPVVGRLVGNFPQAFSHVSLVNSASKIAGEEQPSAHHVSTGIARRAMRRRRTHAATTHLTPSDARDMLDRMGATGAPIQPTDGQPLSTSDGSRTSRIRGTAGGGKSGRKPRVVTSRSRPTRKVGAQAAKKASATKAAKEATTAETIKKSASTAKKATAAAPRRTSGAVSQKATGAGARKTSRSSTKRPMKTATPTRARRRTG